MPDVILTQQRAIVAVQVQRLDGTWLDLGTEFRELSGIGVEGESTSIRPGSMAPPEPTPATYTYNDITAQRTLRHSKDSGLVQEAIQLTTQGALVKGTRQPVDVQGKPGLHKPTGFEGVLNAASESDYDADGNEAHTLTIGIVVGKVA